MIEVVTSRYPYTTASVCGEAQADGTAMMPVSSIQKKFRDSFGGSTVDVTKWDVTNTGMTISVAAGVLTIATGATSGATASLLSKDTFTLPVRIFAGFQLSQRVANQDFFIELVSVAPDGTVDNLSCCAWLLRGTTATQGIYRVQNNGITPLDSSASTINTTASYSILELDPHADETYFHARLMDSTAGRSSSYVRHQQIPDPKGLYKLRIRALNTAAASNTNFMLQFVAAVDYAEITAEVTSGSGSNVAGQGIAANVVSIPALVAGAALVGDVSLQYRAGATGGASVKHIVSLATTNAANVKASAGRLVGWALANTVATWRYVKLHNSASAPTAGASVYMTIAIPPNSVVNVVPAAGVAFSTGIGYTIVTGAADTDAAAVAVNDVVGDLFYV